MTLLRHGRPKPPCLPILGFKPRTLWRRASLGPWLPIWPLLLSLFAGCLEPFTTAAQAPAVTAQVPAAAASSSGWAAPGVSTAALPWDPIGPGTYHAAFTLRKADAVQPVHVVRVEQGHPYV